LTSWIRPTPRQCAERQSAGKGRSGRSWTSEAGNLYASLLITLEAPAPKAYQLSLVAGVAVYDAVAALLADHALMKLKWPNDILLASEKAGGILIESTVLQGSAPNPLLAAVIGIGVNVASHPLDLERPVTSLAAHGVTIGPEALLLRIAESAEGWLSIWNAGEGFSRVREAWLTRAHPIGERMSINTGSERVAGTFEGLDCEGGLLIDAGAGIRRFAFGDVSLVP
jgi:BirA family transcriptional regulator, biotin operon repressor / biotin---[acetyl-CoA-carboxylase] ligase